MPIQSPQELLAYELQSIRDAEEQAFQTLQQIEKTEEGKQMKKLLDQRLKQGERLLRDVDKSLEKLDGGSRNTRNAAARGLIQEWEKMVKEVRTPEMKQAVTIAGLQKLEHYCIASWGTVKAMAQEAGEQQLAKSMERALEEGYKWDSEMTRLAEKGINREAFRQSAQA